MRSILVGTLVTGLVAVAGTLPAHADEAPSITAAGDCAHLTDGTIEITLATSITTPVDDDVEVASHNGTGRSFVALGTVTGPDTRDLGSIPAGWQGRRLTATFSGQPSQTIDAVCGPDPASSDPSPSPRPVAAPAPEQAPAGADAAATLAPCVVPPWSTGASIKQTQHRVHLSTGMSWTLQVLRPGTQVPGGSRLSITVQG